MTTDSERCRGGGAARGEGGRALASSPLLPPPLLPSPRRGHQRYLANDPPDARLDQIIDNMAMMRAIDPQTAARARDEILRLGPAAR